MVGFFDTNKCNLEAFVNISSQIGARVDFVQGGGGNTSVKLEGGLMAIKASGYRLSDIKADDGYAVLKYREIHTFFATHEMVEFEDIEATGADFVKAQTAEIHGLKMLRPSVEAGFHSLLDRYVIHSHSVYANLAACSTNCEQILKRALDGAPYSCCIVAYTDPGTRLTFTIRDEIKRMTEETGLRPAAIIMKNHGLIVHNDDDQKAIEIHADINERIARIFGISATSFPLVQLTPAGEGKYISNTSYLKQALLSGAFSREFLLKQPLYPDQIVFLNDTLEFGIEPRAGCCALDETTGIVTYRMPPGKALVVEETLTAITYITNTIRAAGYTLAVMGEAAKSFIANWESEKYRKTLSGS